MINDETAPADYHVPGWLGVRPGSVWVDLVLGTPTTGLWCDTCLLPSRYEVLVYVLGDDGPIKTGVIKRCDDGDHA